MTIKIAYNQQKGLIHSSIYLQCKAMYLRLKDLEAQVYLQF